MHFFFVILLRDSGPSDNNMAMNPERLFRRCGAQLHADEVTQQAMDDRDLSATEWALITSFQLFSCVSLV